MNETAHCNYPIMGHLVTIVIIGQYAKTKNAQEAQNTTILTFCMRSREELLIQQVITAKRSWRKIFSFWLILLFFLICSNVAPDDSIRAKYLQTVLLWVESTTFSLSLNFSLNFPFYIALRHSLPFSPFLARLQTFWLVSTRDVWLYAALLPALRLLEWRTTTYTKYFKEPLRGFRVVAN